MGFGDHSAKACILLARRWDMTNTKDNQAHQRKDAHLDLAKAPASQAQITHPFDSVTLRHHALPTTHLADISLETRFCNTKVASPLFIGAMTGGTDRADKINHALAEVAADQNIALALGSQRASLSQHKSQHSLRAAHPNLVLIGNLGITQLSATGGLDMAMRAIEDIEANAMAIHLNPLQEAAQIEGDHDWRGTQDALADFIAKSPVPVIVKEVGAGIHGTLAALLAGMGAAYIDIAGLGGTNWTRIEVARRQETQEGDELFTPFLDWGIDTKSAIIGARAALPQGQLIASGGIRHGLDVAKAIALGANMVCAAGPLLRALEDEKRSLNQERLSQSLNTWHDQLRLACFLTNSKKAADLAGKCA